ncbi:AAA family ATPase [Mesorhizobium album]|uniref:adenylate/guanylate cyclase domain-containing protein n=1 Tax=Mesorhizobium album TaxID=3072314 RepID=UPI003D311387
MQCPQCQAATQDGKIFCDVCGTPLPQRCPACGAESQAGKKFCGDCGSPLTGPGSHEVSRAAPVEYPSLPSAPDTISSGAERRQIAVMFCDLVGSTTLSARLDPEDLRGVIGAYHARVADVVGKHEGFVAHYMGDGVLAYFGYPEAHEDDAERAVSTGLDLVDAVGQLPAPEPLQVRVGIATGVVVVGDLVGSGGAHERDIVGETPNLAARLQTLAEPDSVMICPTTRRLLGNLFEYKDFGKIAIRGFVGHVGVAQVLRPSAIESRFEAFHASVLTPLVGREEEIALLLERWAQAKDGEGQVVVLSGEPGIGKSRTITALLEQLRGERHTRLRHFCSPHHQDSPLYPIIRQLERAAGFERDDTPVAKLDKLATLFKPTAATETDLALLAELLSVSSPEANAAQLELAPQKKKERIFAALRHQLEVLAGNAPVLMVFEDAHWADPTSRELLDDIVIHAARLPLLAVITCRPEFQPPWVSCPHVTLRPLNRLGPSKAAALVRRIVQSTRSSLANQLVDEIVDRTDGIPLFLEELTKAVLEAGAVDTSTNKGRPISALSGIPATLHASLMARLDRLGTAAKEAAQVGAALGRDFSYEFIRAVAKMSDEALDEQLSRLVAAELVFERGTRPDTIYTFKHALIQEAAYTTLLRADRQRLHARIAETVELRFPERCKREPELLAHHFAEARQIERALDYMLQAGARAVERSANVEAIRHLTRGLETLETLPEGVERDRRELAFQVAIGTPLIAVHGYSAPQTGAAYSRARILCERLGEPEPLVATLSGEFAFHFVRGDHPMMQRLVQEARQISERSPNPLVRLASHRLAGITATHGGAFADARLEFEAILALYDPSQHRGQPVHYVHDPMVSALTYLALVLWILGFPDQARRVSIAAFACAAELNQANLTAHVHNYAGAGLDELLRNVAGVRGHAEAIIELAERHSLHYWRLNALILQGWTRVQEGAGEAGIALMRQSVADRAAFGVNWYQARYLSMLAAAHAQLGQAEEGLHVIARAHDLIVQNSEHMWAAELQRLEGELRRLQGGSPAETEACFERALSIARSQSAKSFELRAASSLARLWLEQGRCHEGRHLLAPIYHWFSEGFETPDLMEAKLLLEDLEKAGCPC